MLTGRRSVLYYDTPDATYVFVFKVYGHSEEGLELYDRFKKPMANYVYPKNLDLNDLTSAPEMSAVKPNKVSKGK